MSSRFSDGEMSRLKLRHLTVKQLFPGSDARDVSMGESFRQDWSKTCSIAWEHWDCTVQWGVWIREFGMGNYRR